jgi:phage-related protein
VANALELAVKVTASTADAQAGLEAVGASAKTMATEVQTAASKADAAAGKMDRLGGAAEGVDDKMGRATGAMGALSSGFELIGAEKAAAGLQSAAMATDFLSGAGQALVLITDAEAIANAKTTVTTIAKTAAEKAAATAAKATAAAQWLLNAAMSANPIGLVVIAVVALVAGFILLYKKSDKFRELVNKLWSVVKTGAAAAGRIIKTGLGAAITVVKGYFTILKTVASTVFEAIKTAAGKVKDAFGKVKDIVLKVVEKVRGIEMPGAVKDAIDNVREAFDKVLGVIKDIIDFIGKIHIPKMPDWIPGVGKSGSAAAVNLARGSRGPSVTGASTRGAGGSVTSGPSVQIIVQGAVDPYNTAKQVRKLITRAGLITGTVTP